MFIVRAGSEIRTPLGVRCPCGAGLLFDTSVVVDNLRDS